MAPDWDPDFDPVSWLSFLLLAAPSHPFGQWSLAVFVPIYSRGAAEDSHFLPEQSKSLVVVSLQIGEITGRNYSSGAYLSMKGWKEHEQERLSKRLDDPR